MVALNSFVIRPLDDAETTIVVDSKLYRIESSNAIEITNQSVAIPGGNEHTIIKTADDSTIGTKIPAGNIAVFADIPTDEEQERFPLVSAVLLPQEI